MPSIFQRAMELALADLLGKCVWVFIDDLVVASSSPQEHERDLEAVFSRLRKAQLHLKASKCFFGKTEIQLLGYIISPQGIRSDPEKVSAIVGMPAPATLKQVRSFVGMVNYYSKTIPGYARITEPLVKLTRKNQPFVWGHDQQKAFETLKELLISSEVMAYPRTDRPYKLYTDASDTCVGGILVQDDKAGVEKVVQYISHQLSNTQRKWSTIEKEAYAVVYCIDKLRAYLYGAEFTVFTDHKPLRSLFTKEMRNTKIQRWGVFLAEFGAKIRYIQGARNVRADLMSRMPPLLSVAVLDTAEWVDPEAMGSEGVRDFIPLEADHLDAEEVRLAQQEQFATLFVEAQGPESDYEVHDGLLYSIKRPTNASPWYPRLVLPEQFRNQIIDRCHKEVGHMSTMKTLNRVREAYVWSGMRTTIADRLKVCPLCATNQTRTERPPMSEMPLPTYCMQVVGVDLIGPFVPSEQGNRYALTIVDHLSGWAEAIPIPNKSSAAVEAALAQEFIPRHASPEVMVTDRGLEFLAGSFRKYLKGLGIEHRQSTPYHPETNGKVERLNRTLKEMITKLVNNQTREWQTQLANALYAHRNSVSDSTGFTPFYLMYGRRGRMPLSRCLGASSGLEALGGRLSDLSEALSIARQNLEASRKYNRERINRRANAGELKPGDSVVLKSQEKLTFTSGWDPQYEVFRVRGPVCWIRQQQTGKTRVVNRSKLLLVDPNIAWDELRARPRRDPRTGMRLSSGKVVPTEPIASTSGHQGNAGTDGNLVLPPTNGSPNRTIEVRAPPPEDGNMVQSQGNDVRREEPMLTNGEGDAGAQPPQQDGMAISTREPVVPTHRYFTRSRGSVPPPPSPPPRSTAVKRRALECPTEAEQKRQRLEAVELAAYMCA